MKRWTVGKSLATLLACAALCAAPAVVFAAAGDLDPSFGTGGVAQLNVGGSDGDLANALALEPNGNVLLAGDADHSTGTDNLSVVQLDSAGVVDPAFTTVTDLGDSERLRAVALQSDGKIVGAGSECNFAGCDMLVVRFNTDGTLDSSFGTGGKVTVNFDQNEQLQAIAIQPDGKIVVGGLILHLSPAFEYDFAVARLDATGALDPSFGSGGIAQTSFGDNAMISGIALQGDGKIVAAGRFKMDQPTQDIALARYNSDGSPDSGFGTGGQVVTDAGGSDQARAVAVQPDGKILAAGTSYDSISFVAHAVVTRYATDGSLDTAFGSGGVAYGPDRTSGNALALQPDGKIVVAGIWDSSPSGFGINRMAAFRFNSDGSVNGSYGSGGIAALGSGSGDEAAAVAVQPDGRVVIGGHTGLNIAAARFLASETLLTQTVGAGDTVQTAPQPTADEPVAIGVTSPNPGDVSITATPTAAAAPSGYTFVGSEYDITAPAATLGGTPLTLAFRLDPSLFPPGDLSALQQVAMLRDGLPLRDCSTGALDGTNSDDACSSTSLDGSVGVITVTSWHASKWHAARVTQQPFPFSGFFAPVDNRDSNGNLILNKVNAGSAVPVKFSLGGDRGLSIFAAGSPSSIKIPCDPAAPIDPLEQTVPASATSLSYDARSQRYTYAWKTLKTFNTCRQLRMTLIDGTTHVADFKFTK